MGLVLPNNLKGPYNATCTFTSCLNWNVCWQCVKIHPVFLFVISLNVFPFLKSRCLSVWHHTDGGPSHDCWLTEEFQHRLHWCLTSDPPWVSCHQLFQRRSRCRQEWLLSDRGVLLLDVLMYIAVTIYSRHLSRWRRLRLVLKGICPRST